ncbi:MAG: heme-binding domain-containing protein [Gemmatimonadales bacterium]|jgi:hypothetical protein
MSMSREKLKKWLKVGGLALVGFLVLAQFVPVQRTNPPVGQEIQAPPEVMAVLQRSCYDCHSNETVWPAYSRIAPISWLVVHDVKEGRSGVNYSEWGALSDDDKLHLLEETWEEVEKGEMPLKKYTLIHQDARLSDADRATLRDWTRSQLPPEDMARRERDEDGDVD